jgi:hypothetical protein
LREAVAEILAFRRVGVLEERMPMGSRSRRAGPRASSLRDTNRFTVSEAARMAPGSANTP